MKPPCLNASCMFQPNTRTEVGLTRELRGTVDVALLVVVVVVGGERQASGGVCPQRGLQRAQRVVLLHPQRVLGVATAEAEGQLHAGHVARPVGELHLEDVAASFGDGVDLLQTHPELSWRREQALSESWSCHARRLCSWLTLHRLVCSGSYNASKANLPFRLPKPSS